MSQKMVFGSSPITTADVNDENMKKLLKKSYHLPSYPGDSVADTILLETVKKDTLGWYYCVRYKNDSTRIAIEIHRLGFLGYELTTYWKNKFKKRITNYNVDFKMSGKYSEYYSNGWAKVTGYYENGQKNGEWKFYSEKGNKTSKKYYKDGLLVISHPTK
jgi:hypothetical protein